MDFHQQDSDLLTSKLTNHMGKQLTSQGLGSQEQSDCSYSSRNLSSSEQINNKNNNAYKSSFKKVSKSTIDLESLTKKHSYICAYYNILGKCLQEHCKKRHTLISEKDGLSELISDNIDLIDNLINSGKKLKLSQSTYKAQLAQYRKCKSHKKEIADKLEYQFSDQEKIAFGDFSLRNLWNPNTFQFLANQIQSQPNLNSNLQGKNINSLIKPKPLVDYKQVSDNLENSSSPLNISGEIRKELMFKLKSDIDKMQNKIKIITMLKKWINNQAVDQNEYTTLQSSLSQIQQIHYFNFFKITNMPIPNQINIDQQFQSVQNVQQ